MIIIMEIWKDVNGYEGLYKVSNIGNILSLKFNRGKKEKLLAKTLNQWGYYFVCLTKNEKKDTSSIHRLVAEAFIPNPENKNTINHKDGNKINNHVSNLEWCTISENLKHSFKTGQRDHLLVGCTQLSKDGFLINDYKSVKQAEKETGVYSSNICRCLKGKTKSAGGFIWL